MTRVLSPRIAVVHEWLLDYAGSERVLREILATVPGADLYTLVDLPDPELLAAIPQRARGTSFLQRLPRARRWLRYYLPLMPLAVRGFDLSRYDVVISSNHAVAKGVRTTPSQMHLSYVHSPMRYAWEMRDEYLRAAGLERGLLAWTARFVLARLRDWDAHTARGVDVFLANSSHVATRVREAYGRGAEVLHPPVDVAAFPLEERKDDYYVTVSRLESYKRIDLLLEAFARMPQRRLVVIGDGPEMRRLQASASPNVRLLGRLPSDDVRRYLQRARAFLFAGLEDFGIVMAEAQSCGTPVIAFGRGGAADIVRIDPAAEPTGVLFSEQSSAAIVDAIMRFEGDSGRFCPAACHENALRFDRAQFRRLFAKILRTNWERFPSAAAAPPDR
jgi:glycosyltransferase involved in cell wall biosynthesis